MGAITTQMVFISTAPAAWLPTHGSQSNASSRASFLIVQLKIVDVVQLSHPRAVAQLKDTR